MHTRRKLFILRCVGKKVVLLQSAIVKIHLLHSTESETSHSWDQRIYQCVSPARTCASYIVSDAWRHHYLSQEMISPTEICRSMAWMTLNKATASSLNAGSPIRAPSHVSVAQPEFNRRLNIRWRFYSASA